MHTAFASWIDALQVMNIPAQQAQGLLSLIVSCTTAASEQSVSDTESVKHIFKRLPLSKIYSASKTLFSEGKMLDHQEKLHHLCYTMFFTLATYAIFPFHNITNTNNIVQATQVIAA